MRIIDKNTDFYDFYQGIYKDDSIVFDRTDSFILTKEEMCSYMPNIKLRGYSSYLMNVNNSVFMLLQICNKFWLFNINITETDKFGKVTKCDVELLNSWNNYRKERCVERLYVIDFPFSVRKNALRNDDIDTKPLVDAVDMNNYTVFSTINKHIVKGDDGSITEKHIPLLKACGIAQYIDPLEAYLSFEEYFSLEKTKNERTESIGITDKEKIENHGFDAKKSFRGNN